ncbi:MAG TPA: flagellar basal-body rod protein FlgF [Phenylobacterium sp.]|uniref:flagellar basal-body rod protein FlgF n=1 Tax=Phenylobacterium sp. TaxID=1871053 RepID=UPI002B45B744|nr:flagellar basal-body rod protein FlgF [Phenylobacterium sp.]HKR88429.1 flagellar basal-body rod protein FlgF [Phenylobacterium sp.]HKT54811.1 flagellar basal-body rod protein FlgF [Caulobacteraceae bacterium]
MDNALYVGLSRQMVLRRQLDIVANNIANADTSGFKVEELLQKTNPAEPAYTLQGPRPVKFVGEDGVIRDFGQGSLRRTDAPLDLAIEGKGFFQVQSPSGPLYTRDGAFQLNDNGVLVTAGGYPVMDDGGGSITLDPQLGQVSISQDGTITQGSTRVGKLAAVNFQTLATLQKTGDNLYRNTSNQQPTPVEGAKIRQGMLEGSNVNSILEISKMIEISRAYEQMAKIMDSNSELSKSAVARMGKAQ